MIFTEAILENTSTKSYKVFEKQPLNGPYNTAWNVSKYGVFSGPNKGKYGPEKTPYLDTFHEVQFQRLFNFRLLLTFKSL